MTNEMEAAFVWQGSAFEKLCGDLPTTTSRCANNRKSHSYLPLIRLSVTSMSFVSPDSLTAPALTSSGSKRRRRESLDGRALGNFKRFPATIMTMLSRLAKKISAPTKKMFITVVAVVASVSLVGLVGYQSYAAAQSQARTSLAQANGAAETSLLQFETLVTALEATITSAQSLLDSSSGKTLNETARTALEKAIDLAGARLQKAVREARVLTGDVSHTNSVFDELLVWPPSALEAVAQIKKSAASLSEELKESRKQLAARVNGVVQAQKVWQAEQDRLAAAAAEEAARAQAERLSKPKQISSESTLSPTGGATAPSAPPPPDVPAPVDAGFDIAAYLSQFVASGDYSIQYVNGLCNGYYICGRTLVGGGGNPVIQLDGDPAVLDIYSTDAGKYVLVHEAAHVRQFWFYGTVALMISESGKFVSYPGTAAVEYMADCATIAKIGYALGGASYPYTSSCTPEQYAEASRIW
jgi:hypothetical protein